MTNNAYVKLVYSTSFSSKALSSLSACVKRVSSYSFVFMPLRIMSLQKLFKSGWFFEIVPCCRYSITPESGNELKSPQMINGMS